MLEKVDLNKNMKGKEFKSIMEDLQPRIAFAQRKCKELKIPVMIVFEGMGAAGKGTLINRLIEPLDPRGFMVYSTASPTLEEKMHPFLWRFFTKLPSYGRIAIFDRSWYRKVLADRFERITKEENVKENYSEICSFEKLLSDDGMLIIKLCCVISKKEQKKRFDKLLSSKSTKWRVSEEDLNRNKEYDKYLSIIEQALEATNTDYAPWNIVEATDREYAAAKVMEIVTNAMEKAIKKASLPKEEEKADTKELTQSLRTSILKGVTPYVELEKAEYNEKLQKLQKRLSVLHNEIYKYRIPVILAFEGWDAGGKGGAIKRLTSALDPRGYMVNPVSSPNDEEKAHHYLWRFWKNVPKDGHIAIFDRSWYGRVMVERIEGFCSENEWRRAYQEMNDMEAQFYNAGAVVLKFFMHIDKDEQERRFKERQENPEKQWKITEEDWRNRARWDEYEVAIDEMIIKTSTTYAPWIVVEGNNKYYARIKVLETVVNALEDKLKQVKGKK